MRRRSPRSCPSRYCCSSKGSAASNHDAFGESDGQRGSELDLRESIQAIRKRWWLVTIVTIFGGCVALGWIVTTPPTYAANVTFFVNTSDTSSTTNVNPLQLDQYAQQRVTSYVQLMSSERLANMIVADTHVNESASDVADSISATSPLNSVILTVRVTDQSSRRALEVAKSISTQFVSMIKVIDPTVHLEVTSDPALERGPVAPREKLDLGLGVMGGLLIGLAAAILRELLDTTVRSATDLRNFSGTAMLGIIRRDATAKRAPLTLDANTKSTRAEEFRQLRTNLQFVHVTGPARVLVLTSSVANEGKSSTATNLAAIAANSGLKVLLIEADLRKPKIADYLAIERAVGLTNVLAGQVAVDKVLQAWGHGGLTVLPSGTIPPNPSELLGSPAMRELLGQLRDRFDMIVIDTPPLLPVTDAAVLAVQADGVVLIARYGKTKWTEVDAAITTLSTVDARLLGCVLNMAPAKGPDSYQAYAAYSSNSNYSASGSGDSAHSELMARAEVAGSTGNREDEDHSRRRRIGATKTQPSEQTPRRH